jgi:hypothetical protein
MREVAREHGIVLVVPWYEEDDADQERDGRHRDRHQPDAVR